MKRMRLVLVISANDNDAEELNRKIAEHGIDNLELRYATDLREAQRAVRAEQFTAIVALDPGYVEFCDWMVAELSKFGSWLDVIIAKGGEFDPETMPYGVMEYTSIGMAAIEVLRAVNYQNGLEAERRQRALDARESRQRRRAGHGVGTLEDYETQLPPA